MVTKKTFIYGICGCIILASWVLCLLPTVFYMSPIELPANDVNLSLLTKFVPSFPCNSPLIFSNHSGYCKPPCDWLSFSEQEQRGMAIADWTTAMFCTICFCFAVITWFKLPEFVRFPHFIILLLAGISAFIEILVIIPKLGKRSKFFCSSEYLDEAIPQPTSFCQIQGGVIHYISLVTGELFVIYNAVLLKHLVIDKRPKDGYSKKFQTILWLIVAILPITPIVYVAKSGDSYTPVYLRFCFPRNIDEAYFTCFLPQQLFLGVGVTCLLLVIFKLIKERKSTLIGCRNQARRRQLQMQKIAVQFIMVIISYIACVYLTYGLLCIQLNNRKAYKIALEKYFQCLIYTSDCPQSFLEYETSYAMIILSLLAGNVFQAGTLVLLLGKPKTRNLWRSWLHSLTRKSRNGRKMAKTLSAQQLQPPSTSEKNDAGENVM